jgi:hypothetical protein
MADDTIDLIRRFEPVLYFHKDERFFPSDAKRYLEHCALWDAKGPPFDDKAKWGGTSPRTFPHFPRIARGKLVVLDGEPPVVPPAPDGSDPGKYIGESGIVFLNLLDTSDEERFLDPAGWVNGDKVDANSANRFAAVNNLGNDYNSNNPELKNSRFWYHAELFDASRLRLAADRTGDFTVERFAKLSDPALLCYYLFFPAHIEPLEGCSNEIGKRWASYAGEWACIAILLEGDGHQSNFRPTQIGLTSRNIGAIPALGMEPRVGMTLTDWNLATTLPRDRGPNRVAGDHPRVFVSLNTHSLYLDQASRPAAMFSPVDFSANSCGVYEPVAQGLEKLAADAKGTDDDAQIALVKIIAGAAALALAGGFTGWIGGAIVGGSAGDWAAVIELVARNGWDVIADPDPLETTGAQTDHPAGQGEIGTVIHSVGLTVPDAPADQQEVWPRFKQSPSDPDPADPTMLDEDKVDTVIDGRAYSLSVVTPDRPRPIWLPSETQGDPSFRGRWGNRVVDDPFNRRAGMRFPDFAGMFLDAIGR